MTYRINAEFAQNYDQYVTQGSWHSPEILFGLSYEFLKPGEKILDIGVGTGLSARPFVKMGLTVYGIDHSPEMVEVCEKKKLVRELKLVDISKEKFPYQNQYFHHVIASGLFHLTGDLDHVFKEVCRVMAKGGLFVFTTDEYKPTKEGNYQKTEVEGV